MFATLALVFALAGSAVAAPQLAGFQQPALVNQRFQPQVQTFTQPQSFTRTQQFALSQPLSPSQTGLLPPVFENGRRVNDAPAAQPVFFPGQGAALQPRPHIPVVSRTHQSDDSGAFFSSYVTSNGQSVQEQGSLIPTNDNTDVVLAKSGSYSFTSPEGVPVSVSYVADASGYRANSPNLPDPVQAAPATF